jgi:hypothetical protein
MGAERTLMWKPTRFASAKRRMTGREVHVLASQLLGGACPGPKGQIEWGSSRAGTGLIGRPPQLPYKTR